MPAIQAGSNEAVIFFKGDLIDKEVLYPEFEAVLDGYIALPNYSGRLLRAVFLQISPRLSIQGAVFFTVPFTEDGQVEGSWNIPLQHLADHGTFGPDLGEGPLRLACRSSCPVAWYKEQLWDPDMQGSMSTFDLLVKAVERNRLGLVAEKPAPKPVPAAGEGAPAITPTPMPAVSAPASLPPSETTAVSAAPPKPAGPVFNRKYRQRMVGLRQKHRLELKTLAERLKRRVEATEAQYEARLGEQAETITELKQRLSKSRRKELELTQSLDSYRHQFDKIREQYEHSLSKGSAEYAAELEILRERFNIDLREKLAAQAEELQERIAMREAELHYRDKQLSALREDFTLLKKEHQSLLKNDSGQVLQRMTDSGITFVAYHPGIEHLVLAPMEITDYLKNPAAFVAERCEVSEEHYREWLMHYRLPVCRHVDAKGETCGEPIDKVLKPRFFRHGESDRCREHRNVPDPDRSQVVEFHSATH